MAKGKKDLNCDNGKGPAVKTCSCQSVFQDKRHGKGKRIHSRRVTGKLVCSVCGKEK